MAERVGQQLGNYQLVRLLGEGGFAEVYLGTQAAIKVLHTRLGQDDLDGFLSEARTIARLKHPSIVRVLDFGVEGSTPFLVLDFAANGTLRQKHPKGQQTPLATILPYVKQVADALSYAHEQKLIHRDIKPENMLVGERNEVLLSDFGIAIVAQSSRSQSTQDAIGTVAYMAPEQIQGKPRPASDQYSLGIVVYEWLTGARPFSGGFTELCSQHLFAPPPPLREKLPTIPPALEEAVLIALAKDPKERFASVLAFATALEQADRADGSVHVAPTQIIRPTTLLEPTIAVAPANRPLEPTIAVTPANTPAAAAYMPTILPPRPPAQSGPTGSSPTSTAALLTYSGHVEWVCAVAWSRDGKLIASGSYDGAVQVWGAATGEIVFSRRGHYRDVRAVSWSPDSRYVASGGFDKTVQVWNVANGAVSFTYRGHNTPVVAVAWSPGGREIASASGDGAIEVWDALTGEKRFISHNHTAGVYTVAWSPDGQRLATGSSDKTAQVWSIRQRSVYRYGGHTGTVYAVAWSPDGRRLASASEDKTVQVWEAASGQKLSSYPGSAEWVRSIAWSPDGRSIASVGADGSAQVWEAISGKHLFTYHGHEKPVTALAWSPDGTRIASAGKDKTVQVWSAG